MTKVFLDTNILIRYLTRDDPKKAKQAKSAIDKLEKNTLTAITTEAVIIEAVHILSSKKLYNLPREEVKRHLAALVRLKGLKIPNKLTYLRAFDLYASSTIDFVDVLLIAHMQRTKISTILSFDQDFDRIPGVKRLEPVIDSHP